MMSNFYQKLIQSTLIAGGIFATTPLVWATSFTINSGETVTTAQTLNVDGETGLIVSGGFLNVTGIPITVNNNADNVVITNNGTITATQDAINGSAGTGTTTVTNNGTITTTGLGGGGTSADAINFTGSAPTLILTNNGTIQTFGSSGAEAVVMGGDNNIVINNGTIETTAGDNCRCYYHIFR